MNWPDVMQFGYAADCEACEEKHDGKFDVEDLFTVELCGSCARALRHAMFHDNVIVAKVKDHKHAAMFETTGGVILTARIINGTVTPESLHEIVSDAKELIIDTRRDLYDAVIAWCDKRKKPRQ